MDINLEAYKQAGWERYSYLAVAALLVYEYLLQFSNEVELFWKKRWSFGKFLFLWSRYYSLALNISNAVAFLKTRPSYEVSELTPFVVLIGATYIILQYCSKNFQWLEIGGSLQMITTHITLELRLYAMYGRSRKILAILLFLIACEACAMSVIFGVSKAGLIVTNYPAVGVFICADNDPFGEHWTAFYWTAALCIQFVLLLLALYQAWKYRDPSEGGGLMRALTRESVLYFFVIFWIYLVSQVLWIHNGVILNEFGTGYSFVISAIIANRLMITVRAKYYEVEESEHNLATIRFNHFTSRNSQQTFPLDEGDMELDRPDNSIGSRWTSEDE